MATRQQQKTNPQNDFEQFERMSEENLESVEQESNFFTFEPNERYDFKFLAWANWIYKDEDIRGVELEDKEGTVYRSSLTVLKSKLKLVTPPCFIRVITKNKVKGDNGRYLDLDVLTLPNSIKTTETKKEEPKDDLPF
jgi:hypothetical protein